MDCTEAVYSEDYFDFINTLSREVNMRNGDEILCSQPLDNGFEVLFYPREVVETGDFNIARLTYIGVPKCYALMDTSALEGTGILTMQNFPTLPLKGNGVLM